MAKSEPGDLTTRVLVEIRDELRTGLGGLRTELGGLRSEFSEMKDEVRGMKDEIREMKTDLGDVKAELRGMGVTLTQVLRAVEHGNARRDGDVADHETRIRRLEEHAGIQP